MALGRTRLWVIYDHPRDYPGMWVIRVHTSTAAGIEAESSCLLANSLLEARNLLPDGLVCIGRERLDDPAIAEVWI